MEIARRFAPLRMSDKGERRIFASLSYSTDGELTDLLEKMAGAGYDFVSVRGNFLRFRMAGRKGMCSDCGSGHSAGRSADGGGDCAGWRPEGKFCVRTVGRRGSDLPMAEIAALESARLRELGWKCLAVTGQETLGDSRRHLFLVAEDGAREIPDSDDGLAKPLRRSFRRAVSSFALSILFLLFAVFAFLHDPTAVLLDGPVLAFAVAFALVSAIFFVMSAYVLLQYCRHSVPVSAVRRPAGRVSDVLSVVVFAFILASAVFLTADGIVRRGPSPVKRAGGAAGRPVYGCRVPFSMEDAGMCPDGEFRSGYSRVTRSVFGTKTVFFDESFGVVRANAYDVPKVSGLTALNCVTVSSRFDWVLDLFAEEALRTAGADGYSAVFRLPGFAAKAVSVGEPLRIGDFGEKMRLSVVGFGASEADD